MYSVDIYNRVRRACLKDGKPSRETAWYFNKDRKTIAKIIDEILNSDKALIKNQRHTAKRIFEPLRDEHG